VLIGVAELLVSAFTIPERWALLLVGVVALAAAVALVAIAGAQFSRSFESFRRSREELIRNLSWIKTVITYSGRSVAQRRR